jgi:hypothetical protein
VPAAPLFEKIDDDDRSHSIGPGAGPRVARAVEAWVALRAYYTPIAGSRDLLTESVRDEDLLARFERLPVRDRRTFSFGGEDLSTGLGRPGVLSIPLAAFDEVASRLPAEGQAAYFQLLRLSYGGGRNFCRVSKRELQRRLFLSERHLNRVLAGLVSSGAIRALQRTNLGTLYRVRSPDEIEGVSRASLPELAPVLARAAEWARS